MATLQIQCKQCGRTIIDKAAVIGKEPDDFLEANGWTYDKGFFCPDCKAKQKKSA
jgi:hypothetical protein